LKFWPRSIAEWLAILFVVAILAAVLWPAHARGGPSRDAACLSNLKQLGLGLTMYAGDNDEKMPPRDAWMDAIGPYTKNPQIFHCILVKAPGLYGYALNAGVKSMTAGGANATPLVYDSVNYGRNASDLFNSLPDPGRHKGRDNVVFADDHARSEDPHEVRP